MNEVERVKVYPLAEVRTLTVVGERDLVLRVTAGGEIHHLGLTRQNLKTLAEQLRNDSAFLSLNCAEVAN